MVFRGVALTFHVLTRRLDVFPSLLVEPERDTSGSMACLTANPRHVELAFNSSYSWKEPFDKTREIVISIS